MSQEIKEYILKRTSVKWDTLYRRFGTQKVNTEIESFNIYSGMDGKARVLGGRKW
jgi:hypothetical protein